MLDTVPDDIILEITAYLPTVSMQRFFAISKRFWNLRSRINIESWKKFKWAKPKERFELIKLAALKNDKELVELFLSKSVHPSVSFSSRQNAFNGILQGGHKALLNALWPQLSVCFMDQGLAHAAKGGHQDLVEWCLQNGAKDLNAGLMGAAYSGNKPLVEYFVQKGADQWTESFWQAAEAGHKNLVDYFLDKGASNINYGMVVAAKGGHKDLVEYLHQKGGYDLGLALAWAATHGHKEVVQYLLDKGSRGIETAIALAKLNNHTEIAHLLSARVQPAAEE
eukprot:CAMPEP_0168556582 /NCGR_PEP_ID=MMETSP0413-20121227/8961_1 /TAXON_ID=136452 /ORGANISM="Filamoeba nolandi, Strain NC-AS-23-1" /LENGTH=280 /DNA_ID=CAMNT_0008587541 /DNA_START=290 /DNA_END=1132 /DNA_ORIENTATION=+